MKVLIDCCCGTPKLKTSVLICCSGCALDLPSTEKVYRHQISQNNDSSWGCATCGLISDSAKLLESQPCSKLKKDWPCVKRLEESFQESPVAELPQDGKPAVLQTVKMVTPLEQQKLKPQPKPKARNGKGQRKGRGKQKDAESEVEYDDDDHESGTGDPEGEASEMEEDEKPKSPRRANAKVKAAAKPAPRRRGKAAVAEKKELPSRTRAANVQMKRRWLQCLRRNKRLPKAMQPRIVRPRTENRVGGGSGSEALERPRKRTKASGAGGAEENVTSKQSGKGKRKNEVETPEKGEAKQDEKRIQAKKKDLSRKSMAYVAARKKALADGLPEEEAKPKGREATRL